MLINIIGAGRLGKTLGYLLAKTNKYRIQAVCNASLDSAKQAAEFMAADAWVDHVADLPAADVTLITTPDTWIQAMSHELARTSALKPDGTVIHCSGALSSDILHEIKSKGCFVASVHPMKSFAEPHVSITQYAGTYCAVEGDVQALAVVEPIFQSIGSVTYAIDSTKKSSYHAAGVFASNYLVTLFQQALDCLTSASVGRDIATSVITDIMRNTVLNLQQTKSSQYALTGPIKRGDVETVKQHLNAFATVYQQELYAMLGLATLPIAALESESEHELMRIFNDAIG